MPQCRFSSRLIMLALLLGSAVPALAQDRLDVVASFSIVADMVREIGGDSVAVTALVGPNGDAHVYEPSPADARAVSHADVLVFNGLEFEGWLPRLVGATDFSGLRIQASQGIEARRWAGGGAHQDGMQAASATLDPHAWQDLGNGVIYARNIANALVKADPEHAARYERRAADYIDRLETLDRRLSAAFDAVPRAQRTVVTSHDAFQYFGAAYGLDFIAPEGISTEAEASAADVARIIDQIREAGISAVFVENITDSRLIDRISEQTAARVGGELYSDALSAPDGPAPSYIQLFRYNATQLLNALSPDAREADQARPARLQ